MIISSAMDITELKQKDEILIKQSRLAAMGEMIGMIAHQWRQPLSTISMAVNNIFADVALEAFEQEKGLSELESIAYQVQELSKIIDDFRNFFKPDKEASIIKIETIIEETLFIVKDSLINNAIELKIFNNSQTPIEVYSRELMQVFVNVINNSKDALKEVIEKEKIIEINIYEDEEYIITEICDNGTGIDEKILPNIFNPYFSTKDAKTGTGLGLYMSKMIIEDHMHGNIDVKNRDIGVCFIIKLLKER